MPRYRNPCSYLPRRLQIVTSLTGFVLFCILFLGGSSPSDPYLDRVPLGPQLERGAHEVLEHLPYAEKLNPFGQPVHRPPPEQKNSESGNVRWFSDWKWRNPFSSSTTLDEERAVLPHLQERPRVYTYFDPTARSKDEKSRQAEQDLLHIWRRAWWAQGFKPIVLGRPEALNNPMYRRIQGMKLTPELELEMMRWLSWASMGAGIMCNWLALPMAPPDNSLLSFLRRGQYPRLTRFDGLENGLFIGQKSDIDAAIEAAIASPNLATARSIWDVAPEGLFTSEAHHDSIAFYSSRAIGAKYPSIKEYLDSEQTRGVGLAMLPPLINSHLHTLWQSQFPGGIAVLKPLAQNTTAMIAPGIELARNLSRCSSSPLPESCPPNIASCKPCSSSSRLMSITTPPLFKDKPSTQQFTIGTVPHPYTFQTLIHSNANVDLPFIRRKTDRDVWITSIMKGPVSTAVSAFSQLAPFKDAVASEYGTSHSYWVTAEGPPSTNTEKDLEELDWYFGFQIPRESSQSGKSDSSAPMPDARPPMPKQEYNGAPPSEATLAKQRSLLEAGRRMVHNGESSSRDKTAVRLRNIAEAWNLADTEAWKFVRAWNARRKLERKQLEEEEGKFLGKGIYDRFKDVQPPRWIDWDGDGRVL